MSDLETRFVEEYCKDCKGAKAAVRAGYKKENARSTAWELKQKPEIKAAIKKRLKELTITSLEATKNISDIARTRLQDFMIIKKVLRSEKVRKPLSKVISELEDQISLETDYLNEAGLDEKETARQEKLIKGLEKDLIKLKIELRRNPKAYRDVQGEPKWVEQMEFDLVALAKAHDEGNILEFSYGEFGPKIKMYAADKANELILKMKGKLVDRTDHTTKGESVNKGFYEFLKKVNTKK